MKIRILQPVPVRLDLCPGDELHVQHTSQAIEALLAARRLDNQKVAVLVDDDDRETATIGAVGETAVTGRGRARGQRPETLS